MSGAAGSAGAGPRVVAVLDGTGACAERQARALAGFLRNGLHDARAAVTAREGSAESAETVVFSAAEADDRRLVDLAPTADVRLVRVPRSRPDLRAAALGALAAGGGAELFVFPGGPLGAEPAARLAAGTGGGALTGVLDAAVSADGLVCRRRVYSGHLTGHFVLRARPWCLALDASWDDSALEPPAQHAVRDGVQIAADEVSAPPPFADIEVLEPPHAGDLEDAGFLVVAGRGAGRDGVERIAAAATRMGAVFGVTRPVAMNGWAPMDRLVGVSGARTAPAVCITAGVHGAPALLWGIERAAFIAGVDTDEAAPIATEADAVVHDDAAAVIEALAALVERDRESAS